VREATLGRAARRGPDITRPRASRAAHKEEEAATASSTALVVATSTTPPDQIVERASQLTIKGPGGDFEVEKPNTPTPAKPVLQQKVLAIESAVAAKATTSTALVVK
jgi:hypothetical protein